MLCNDVLIFQNVVQLGSTSSTSFETFYGDSAYDIVKLHKYDDVDLMPRWKKTLFRFAPLSTIGSLGSYIVYFAFRIFCTRNAGVKYHKAYWLAWFFIVAEALVACKSRFVRRSQTVLKPCSACFFPSSMVDTVSERT